MLIPLGSGIRFSRITWRMALDIRSTIRSFLVAELGDSGFHDGIGDDESLVDLGILDSLGMLVLVAFINEQYDVALDVAEFDPRTLDSVTAIEAFLSAQTVPETGSPQE
jgi:acyl carrier protein